MAGANLSMTNFNAADLSGANLVEANLNDANFRYADLTGVNLSRANLIYADFRYSKSSDIVGEPTNLSSGWLLKNGYLLGWGAQLNGANLQGLDLSGADLSFSTLKRANLTNTSLSDAVLDFSTSGSILGKASSLPYGWKQVNGYLVGRGAQLDGSDLSGANFTAIDLSSASLKGSNLSNATFKNSNLTGSNLDGADLSGALLSNVSIAGATMRGVILDGTHSDGLLIDHVPIPQKYASGPEFVIAQGGCRITGDFENPSHGFFLNACGPALPANCAVLAGYLFCHGVNLDGDNLTEIATGLSLSQQSPVDLTGASMNGVNVTGANLSLFNLHGVKSAGITGIPDSMPKGWILSSGYLVGQGVDLSGYDLSKASLAGVASGEISGLPKSLPSGWALQNGYLIGPGADLSGANLSGFSLEDVSLSGAVLDGVRSGGVSGSPLSLPTGWALRNGYLLGPKANIQNADLSQTNLQGVSSGGLTGDPKSLPSGWYLIRRGYLVGPGADLSGADLSGLSFDGYSLDLSGANLTRANLSLVNLNSVNLLNANLDGVLSGQIQGKPLHLPQGWVLVDGYLVGPGSNLAGAGLSSSDLYNSDLSGSNLSGADLSGAHLYHVRSGGIVGSPISLPPGWVLRSGYLLGPTSDLSQCDLSGLQMDGIDLSKATLKGVKSGNDSGTPMQLPPNWRLIGGFLVGPGANLTGSSFTETSFQGVSLAGTNLSGSSLSSVNLANVPSGSIQGTPANLPPQWSLVNGYLIGPNADLNFAQLNGANLSNQNLTGVTLGNADLSGVTSGGIAGMPTSLPAGWTISGGYLIGPTANLSNANLSGLSLTGSNLGGATLAGANLKGVISGGISGLPSSLPSGWTLSNGYLFGSGANLANANLTGMNLTGVDLSGATLAGAQLAGVNMTNTKLAGVDLTGAYVGSQVWWLPKGWAVLNGTVQRTYSKTPPPKMVGQLATGKIVKCSASLWAPSAFVTYQWLLDGKKIAGATSASFRISTTQKGHKLSVTIAESAAGYISASATSSAVKIG